jgi:hypothetical protein
MQFSAMYIADYMQADVPRGRAGARGSVTEVTWIKTRSRDFHLGSHWLIPSPRYFAKLFSEILLHDCERLAGCARNYWRAAGCAGAETDNAIFCGAEITHTREVVIDRRSAGHER